jgi:hypothetical protein
VAVRPGKYARRKELAIAALIAEPTIQAAARRVGVCPRTLRYWLARPDFAEAFRKARQAVLDGVVGRLQGVAPGGHKQPENGRVPAAALAGDEGGGVP